MANRSGRLKTYSRLRTGRRVPTEYEVVSSRLHYHFPHRFELGAANPVIDWYYRHREGSPFQASDWEAFSDPRQTTYHRYTSLQDDGETVIDGLLREIEESGYDDDLAGGWVEFLDRWYGPLRFPVHGLEMLAAYVAQMAPASRITNCAAFQAADEMRRLQRIAYRTAQLRARRRECEPEQHRHYWEADELFQPLRELIELALVAYDWGEAFVALNLVIKPHVDRLVNEHLAGALANANGDSLLASIHFSLNEDARWHRLWAGELLRVAVSDTPANATAVAGWLKRWRPLAMAAVTALAGAVELAPIPLDPRQVVERVERAVAEDLPVDLRPEGA